ERPGFRNRYRTTLRPDLPRYPPGLGNRLARTVRYGEERLLQYSGLQRRHGRPSGNRLSVLKNGFGYAYASRTALGVSRQFLLRGTPSPILYNRIRLQTGCY